MSVLRLLRLLLFFVSVAGYVNIISKKIKPEFAIGVVFSSIGCLMFFAGMLNILAPISHIIAGGGMCAAFLLLKNPKKSLRKLITPGTVFFAALCVLLLFALKGSMFTGTDAFSHWATVEKVLLKFNRFPVESDKYILFQSYPLGSASFIYYVCKIVGGNSEWLQIFAHAILEASMVVSIFGFVKNNSRISYLIQCFAAAAVSLMLLCNQSIFTNLCVDALLTVVAFSAMALCIYYKDRLADKMWFAVPHMIFLMAVKNSGLLFSAVIALYILFYISKTGKNLAKWAVCAVSPFAFFRIWQKYVEITFSNGLNSLHAMSKEHYDIMYEEKVNSNIVGEICSLFGKEVFSLSNVAIYLFVFAAVIILVYKFVFKKQVKSLVQLSVFTFAVYVVYQLGTLAMYLFSMPSYEALVLPSYSRYHMTVVAFIAGVLICEIWQLASAADFDGSSLKNTVCLCVCVAVLWCIIRPDLSFFAKQNPADVQARAAFGSFVQQQAIPEGSSYIIIDSSENPTLTPYYVNYYLLPAHSRVWQLETLKEYLHLIPDYEYLVIYDNSAETAEYIESLFGHIDSRVIHTSLYNSQNQ